MADEGPSPQARGAAALVRAGAAGDGTIPAGAGSRRGAHIRTSPVGDHPRRRGEQATAWRYQMADEGPSPQARGAAALVRAGAAGDGTIPAGAGSRRGAHIRTSPVGDHPRRRGEQALSASRVNLWLGPSPQARGAGAGLREQHERFGTIPAGAGSSGGGRGRGLAPGDHPRRRGEQLGGVAHETQVAGPSPQARGADRARQAPQPDPGTIPAGAGSRGVDQRLYPAGGQFLLACRDSDIGCNPDLQVERVGQFLGSIGCRSAGVWPPCSSPGAGGSGRVSLRWDSRGWGGGSRSGPRGRWDARRGHGSRR